jgi:hypothetical protein
VALILAPPFYQENFLQKKVMVQKIVGGKFL